MYQNQQPKQRVYTPQISSETAFILRRLAWALNKPMTQTLNIAVAAFVSMKKCNNICSNCRDRRCALCPLTNVIAGVADSAPVQYGKVSRFNLAAGTVRLILLYSWKVVRLRFPDNDVNYLLNRSCFKMIQQQK